MFNLPMINIDFDRLNLTNQFFVLHKTQVQFKAKKAADAAALLFKAFGGTRLVIKA